MKFWRHSWLSGRFVQDKETPGYRRFVNNTTDKILSGMLVEQRQSIEQQMKGYRFHSKLNTSHMKDLVPEEGGQPVRSIIVTTWRSGSTFLGDILSSHPGTFYHYEPLHDFGIKQIRYGDDAAQALLNLKHLLNCEYSEMEHLIKHARSYTCVFDKNKVLWNRCKTFPDLCRKSELLSPFCSLFPFQSLKTVRLRLNLTEELLEDKKLGVRLLFLVRDPRGTLQSRRNKVWCSGKKDCDDPETLCKDLVRDYITASIFRRKFPESFRAVRYEDVSFNAFNKTKELLDFFRLDFHPNIQKFLQTHTSRNKGNAFSTFRDSKKAPVHWQKEMPWKKAQRIQGVCGKALRLWGYEIAQSEEHLRSFMPVGPLELL
ncbi:carbohydrate sulfotransferase 5-like [Penaeus monodon]|uniref:carbohydrate sulfotransferase 5-like n=1 Tax=Penaeus monodon TaxID=6687 RepID=UPI0018A7DD82|nr:carbohydrate sulfotransferase 5-like [Penaeus monodon]